jgi:2-dehydro-3-deoxy-D-arabinonate dehydratase
MKVYKTNNRIIVEEEGVYYPVQQAWDDFINRKNLYQHLLLAIEGLSPVNDFSEAEAVAPIGNQEVWASGVTYMRSREARMEEAKDAGVVIFMPVFMKPNGPSFFSKPPQPAR